MPTEQQLNDLKNTNRTFYKQIKELNTEIEQLKEKVAKTKRIEQERDFYAEQLDLCKKAKFHAEHEHSLLRVQHTDLKDKFDKVPNWIKKLFKAI